MAAIVTEKKKTPIRTLILGAFLIAVIVVVAIVAIYFLSKILSETAILTIVGGGITLAVASYQYNKAKQNEIEARHFSEKAAIYNKIIEQIHGLFKSIKGYSKTKSPEELASDLMDIRISLLIWGNMDTMDALAEIGQAPPDNLSEVEFSSLLVKKMARLYKAIRSDLGHKDKVDDEIRMALQILSDEDRGRVAAHIFES